MMETKGPVLLSTKLDTARCWGVRTNLFEGTGENGWGQAMRVKGLHDGTWDIVADSMRLGCGPIISSTARPTLEASDQRVSGTTSLQEYTTLLLQHKNPKHRIIFTSQTRRYASPYDSPPSSASQRASPQTCVPLSPQP